MFCVKCGNPLREGQQFCTNCGNKVGDDLYNNDGQSYNKEENIPNNNPKRNIDIEETSAKIVSEVTETVNNIVDKSKDVVGKIKLDEKINQCLDGVKKKPNTLKVFGALAIAIIILFTGSFAMLRSTPEKTVKQFAKAIEKKDIKKALKYTNYEKIFEYGNQLGNLFGLDDIYENKDKMLIELQKEFREEYEGITIKLGEVNETFKIGNAAEVSANVIFKDGTDIGSEDIYVTLIKEKGKWLIDITDFDYFW